MKEFDRGFVAGVLSVVLAPITPKERKRAERLARRKRKPRRRAQK